MSKMVLGSIVMVAACLIGVGWSYRQRLREFANHPLAMQTAVQKPKTREQRVRLQPRLSAFAPQTLANEDALLFLGEVDAVFANPGVATLDHAALKPRLMALNARGITGVRTILDSLNRAPDSDSIVVERLGRVDYLRYRLRWDVATRQAVIGFLSQPLPAIASERARASMLAERAELINGLARVAWDLAADVIARIDDDLFKDLATYEAYHGLLEGGASAEYAIELLRTIDANFKAS